jgi:hypothetical protein
MKLLNEECLPVRGNDGSDLDCRHAELGIFNKCHPFLDSDHENRVTDYISILVHSVNGISMLNKSLLKRKYKPAGCKGRKLRNAYIRYKVQRS